MSILEIDMRPERNVDISEGTTTRINAARLDAYSVINANHLLTRLNMSNLSIAAQRHQDEVLVGTIAWHILNEKLKIIHHGSSVTKAVRHLITGDNLIRMEQELEEAQALVEEQNDYYFSDTEHYPRARNIKSLVDELFRMVKNGTGRPISPDQDINLLILRDWQSKIAY